MDCCHFQCVSLVQCAHVKQCEKEPTNESKETCGTKENPIELTDDTDDEEEPKHSGVWSPAWTPKGL